MKNNIELKERLATLQEVDEEYYSMVKKDSFETWLRNIIVELERTLE